MSIVHCFWLEDTAKLRRAFRRYAGDNKCPGKYGYCNGHAPLDEIDWPVKTMIESFTSEFPHTDPRWPTKCDDCGYTFLETDNWQIWTSRLYRRNDTGEITTLEDCPPGAMWDAWWMEGHHRGRQAVPTDKLYLVVKLPDGVHWTVDGPSTGGGPGWVRTGTVPKITARPSILTEKYHGFLTDGLLIAC